MENLELYLSLIGTGASLLLTIIILIVRLAKSIREKSRLKEEDGLLSAVGPLMELAEKHKNFTGEEKKEFVLTKLNQFAIENGINFDTKIISTKIEELINLSKQINYKR